MLSIHERRVRDLLELFTPEGADGGWRGNGNNAPSWYGSNSSSWTETLYPGDPRIELAERLTASIEEANISWKNGAIHALAELIGENWLGYDMEMAIRAIKTQLSPDGLDENERRVYNKINPPTPYTREERRKALLKWKNETGKRVHRDLSQDDTIYCEEILLRELERLDKSFRR